MERRQFLKTALGGAMGLAAAGWPHPLAAQTNPLAAQTNPLAAAAAAAAPAENGGAGAKVNVPLRGVNLGGWLVLEKWMVGEVFQGTTASDEYTLCQMLGDQAQSRLEKHRQTFITAEDFRWIKACGLNAVRLPVGYWALEAPQPYVACGPYIDFALAQCQQLGLKLLLDLHGAPGSQNGWDHSGRGGAVEWPNDPKNIAGTLQVLEDFARHFGQHPALYGIELLNEPRDVVPLPILQEFYLAAYARLRPLVSPGVAIVMHDSFRSLAWKGFMHGPEWQNVILDTHLYQCFDPRSKARNAMEQICFAQDRQAMLAEMQATELPALVGEWSLSLPNKATKPLSEFQRDALLRSYAGAQLLNYESTRGWFFWSYKMHGETPWNFRHCVERGWLPSRFDV
ncbi:MAG TPA: cellulase family glycosylhydrolase [Verrucomicrobiae bacterium]